MADPTRFPNVMTPSTAPKLRPRYTSAVSAATIGPRAPSVKPNGSTYAHRSHPGVPGARRRSASVPAAVAT